MGVSENRGSKYSTLNSRVLIIRTPNKVPLISETPLYFYDYVPQSLSLVIQPPLVGLRALGFTAQVLGFRV